MKNRTCTHWYVCASVHKDLWDSKTTASFRKETNWFLFLLGCNMFVPHLSKYFLFKTQIRIIKCNQSLSWTDLLLNQNFPKLRSLTQLQVSLCFSMTFLCQLNPRTDKGKSGRTAEKDKVVPCSQQWKVYKRQNQHFSAKNLVREYLIFVSNIVWDF